MASLVRKVMVAALCVGLARCEPPALSSQYGVPGNYAGPQGQGGQYQQQYQQQAGLTNSYGAPLGDQAGHHGHDEQQDYIDSQPKSYEFGYAVKDAATGNDYGRRETSDGETVRGEYRVQLPDGRTQIVTYTADWRTGFHADVRYEGVAQYPDQYNNNNNQGYPSSNPGGYDYNGNNNVDAGYNGNQGGYNNYQGAANNYNSGQNYNYQLGSNALDGNYGPPPQTVGGSSYGTGQSLAPPPQQQYGVPFH